MKKCKSHMKKKTGITFDKGWILILALVLGGCAFVSVPDGPKLAAIGQAEATHCPAQEDPNQPGCAVAKGGPLSDGFTGLLKDLAMIPFKMIGGAASAVSQ